MLTTAKIHARLAEIQYITAQASTNGSGLDGSAEMLLTEAVRRFCRSVELCDDYLRGCYGLKLLSQIYHPLSQVKADAWLDNRSLAINAAMETNESRVWDFSCRS